jgi:hypothetical protein
MPDPTRHFPADLTGLQRRHRRCHAGDGPFNVAPGTQYDDDPDFVQDMFPIGEKKDAYNQRMVSRLAKRGRVSVRSGA